MRKRGRENPCFICGHYHKFEEGEVCGVCGHRKMEASDAPGQASSASHSSAFPSEIIRDFLYLGSYDNASRSELLKAQGISHILNAVPTCPNLYRNSFTYFSMPESATTPFDQCVEFLEQARTNGARVLVHCMSGQSRSPSIVAAYLMRREGMPLEHAVAFIKQRRPSVNITQAMLQQLREYEAVVRASHAPQSNNVALASSDQQQQQQQLGALQFDLSAVAGPQGAQGLGQAVPTNVVDGGAAPLFQLQGGQQQAPQVPGAHLFLFSGGAPAPSAQGFVFGSNHTASQGSEG